MITARITNIVLEWERFRIFVTYSNWIEETDIFMPEITAKEIRQHIEDRKSYFNSLVEKETELKIDLLNIEI